MLEREYAFYKDNIDTIRTQYPGQFVVIVGDRVVEAHETQVSAIKSALTSYKEGEFLVQGTSDDQNKPWLFHNSWYSVG